LIFDAAREPPHSESRMQHPLVTIAVPVYKQFAYLAGTLRSVALQDYPNIELLVSDNGMNGPQLHELVAAHYPRPFVLRHNPATVTAIEHFNQLIAAASGTYFVLLCDDDELSPDYVGKLVRLLEAHPDAAVAVSRQETFDHDGHTLSTSATELPSLMPGDQFARVRSLPARYGFKCPITYLARTEEIRLRGGFPAFERGTFSDDALLLRLCLGAHVAFSSEAVFRWRHHEASNGASAPYRELSAACKQFIDFLDVDPYVQSFARAHPERWAATRRLLVAMPRRHYAQMWMYRYHRLPMRERAKAALALRLAPSAYPKIASTLARDGLARLVKARLPWAYRALRFLRHTA